MKTDALIDGLVIDADHRTLPLRLGFILALLAGGLVAAGIFFALIGLRPDFAAAVATPRVQAKFVATALLAGAAFLFVTRLSRPGVESGGARWAILGVAALVTLAVAIELAVVPSDEWVRRLVGRNAIHCLLLIPFLSLVPFVALMAAARHGAPTRPRLTGAVIGLASAGIGAFFYAANCTDDSPLFVATWYTIATMAMAVVGAMVGRRVLKW